MSNQPEWKFVANLGDATFLDHGGYFIFVDKTGVYEPEAELIELDDPDNEKSTYTIYRFSLEKCYLTDGILSDNKFHLDHPAWFAKPESEKAKRPQDSTYLSNVASYVGKTVEELQEQFCSDDVLKRAQAYHDVGSYHGWENLDSYPLTKLSRQEVAKRFAEKMKSAP